MRTVPLDQIHWITEKLQDPTGRAFIFEGRICRTVRPDAVPRVRRMFDTGIVEDLVGKGLLVPTRITDSLVPDAGMVLEHQRVSFDTSGSEWCRPMLRDAALGWLDLNLVLHRHGLATVDAHCGNFGQLGCCRPTWLDFGSIVELTDARQGLDEYHQFFRNPLRLLARSAGLTRLVRVINRFGGLTDYEASSLAYAALPGGRKLQNAMDRGRASWRRARKRARLAAPAIDLGMREAILRRERDEMTSLDLPKLKTTWGDYQPEDLLTRQVDSSGDTRRARILQTIERLRPQTAIDLAGNAGFYSLFAARQGAKVLSLDLDEAVCERFYTMARGLNEPLDLTGACCDVLGGWSLRRDSSRQAELVLALALTHHLTLGQGFSFPFVLATLARYTTDALLVEYMPNGLGGDRLRPDPLPEWYSREIFEDELRRLFTDVELVAEYRLPQGRALYLARGKR